MKSPKSVGLAILKQIEKHQILLLQDQKFPNIIQLITGDTCKGSWWSHPQANSIYNGLAWLADNSSIFTVKLLDGKMTYLHENLLNDFYTIVMKPRDWQLKKLKQSDLEVFNVIKTNKKISSDDIQYKTIEIKKSLARLEKKLLIQGTEQHTKSGKHIKIYHRWKAPKNFKIQSQNINNSILKFEKIVENFNLISESAVKLPWQ